MISWSCFEGWVKSIHHFTYLVLVYVERPQIGIEKELLWLHIYRWLSPALVAHIPLWIDETPEARTCKEKKAISRLASVSCNPRTVHSTGKGSEWRESEGNESSDIIDLSSKRTYTQKIFTTENDGKTIFHLSENANNLNHFSRQNVYKNKFRALFAETLDIFINFNLQFYSNMNYTPPATSLGSASGTGMETARCKT